MFAIPSLLDAKLLLTWVAGRFDEGVRRELDDRTRKAMIRSVMWRMGTCTPKAALINVNGNSSTTRHYEFEPFSFV